MFEKKIIVINKLGLHARPAALIVQTVCKFKSDVKITKDSITANGRSIMSVMMLSAETGSEIKIQANGEDEIEAVNAIAKLFEDKFHED